MKYILCFVMILSIFTGCVGSDTALTVPDYDNVEVHDPSIIKVDDTYYIFGSHLASAKSTDLISWKQISRSPRPDNPMFPNVDEELKETLEYAETNTLWAPDVTQLADGRFYFYYNACRGDSPLSAMGVAVSDDVEGPYKDSGIFLKSGMTDSVYNANNDPNVVDPHVFYDKDNKLWMVYGSYSGGIFVLEIDENTGFPKENQGFGKKLLGGYHARIEGPYIQYSEETDYYYLFLSYGGLDVDGGYNIRVARSKSVDGPYEDSEGNLMSEVSGTPGIIFDDPAYEYSGHKLMGNFQFDFNDEETMLKYGYVSPGHNSTIYDGENYYIIFHSRFPNTGNAHQVRVHQFYFNTEGWPVVAPYRFGGESLEKIDEKEIVGDYALVNHGRQISKDIVESVEIKLNKNGSVTGEINGQWRLYKKNRFEITIGNKVYDGFVLRQYDEYRNQWVMVFTVGGNDGVSLWGVQD